MASAVKHAPKPPYRPASSRPADEAERPADEAANGAAGLSLAHVEGRLKAKTVKKVGDLVETHPDETLTILRGWLHEGH